MSRHHSRQCRGTALLGEERVLELDFEFDGKWVGEHKFHMSLDGHAVGEKDLIALLGPEAARSAIEEATQNGLDQPY